MAPQRKKFLRWSAVVRTAIYASPCKRKSLQSPSLTWLGEDA